MSQSSRVTKEFGAVIPSLPTSSVQVMSAVGAITTLDMNTEVHAITTTGAATLALGNGVLGQRKTIVLVAHGGNLVVTPANFSATTITFDASEEYAHLLWVGGEWTHVGASATVA